MTFSIEAAFLSKSAKAAAASSNLYVLVTILSRSTIPSFTRSINCRKSFFSAFLEPKMLSSFFWIKVKLKSRFSYPTPIRTTRPPKAAASMQIWNVEGRPTASIATSNPFPPVASCTLSIKVSGSSFSKMWSIPKVSCA